MKLWRVVLLVNLALGVGLLLGFLAWGRQAADLLRPAPGPVLLAHHKGLQAA